MRPPGLLEWGSLLGLVLVSILLLTPLIRAALAQRARRTWPLVTGSVVAHHLRRQGDGWVPEHQVRYQWQGVEYLEWCTSDDGAAVTGGGGESIGNRAGHASNVQRAAQRELDRHPVGREIRVLVNPASPRPARVPSRELPLTPIAVVATAILGGFIVALVAWVIL